MLIIWKYSLTQHQCSHFSLGMLNINIYPILCVDMVCSCCHDTYISKHGAVSNCKSRLRNFKLNALFRQASGLKKSLVRMYHSLVWNILRQCNLYVKIINTQSSVGQVLQVFHLSDCHFYSSQTIGRVKFRTLKSNDLQICYVTQGSRWQELGPENPMGPLCDFIWGPNGPSNVGEFVMFFHGGILQNLLYHLKHCSDTWDEYLQ